VKLIRFIPPLLILLSAAVHAAAPTLPEGKNPRFGGAFTGTEDSFTFGIIADRAGGNPLVGWPYFEQAVREMNLLHPDFVLMPGDLIDGYIRRQGPEGAFEDFNEQFDEFGRFANKLEMPLYFVGGNHDLSHEAMKAPYLERFGRLWYSFDYRGVHFIALCTEAQPPGESQGNHFTDEQVRWALADIAAGTSARHTVVFMHYPAWSSRNGGSPMFDEWLQIEEALKGRKYTVIAGHTHRLSTETRNGCSYYVMATSGGSQFKPHSFYRGRTHHIGLCRVERDTVSVSLIELGATHSMEEVAKTRQTPEDIRIIQSLKSNGEGFQAEFAASFTNPLDKAILAEFTLQGLSPNGWRSSAGDRMSAVVPSGSSAEFRTLLTVPNPNASYPPTLVIHARDRGLSIVDHKETVPVFSDEDYRAVPEWRAAAPFDGGPMSYSEPPFDPRNALPGMFRTYGPEQKTWNPDEVFEDGISWKQIKADERGRVDFGEEYGRLVGPVGYAISCLDSPDDRMVYLRFSVNDYGRIFLNGEVVGKDIFYYEDGTVTFPIWLRKGRNSLMVKPANWSNNWYFILRIADPEGALRFE